MSTKPQIELFLENESDTQQVAYPFVESDHVSLSNGMDIDTMIRQDVSMPTVTHEDLSFKVGVGDQDVSSAIVDSSVAEMTIKGKTYQNILPEPSTHVLTNNKEMFKVNEGLDPNVEIVDGVSKSAILSGNTLVNCVDTTVFSLKTDIVSRSDDGIITIPSKNGSYIYAYGKKSSLFKPSTKYTLFLEIMEFSLSGGGLEILNPDSTIFTNAYTSVNATGYKKILLTTKDDISDCDITLRLQTHPIANDGGVAKVRYMILEGDYTNVDIPYFEGMQSVKMSVLKTTGKNLLFNLNPSNPDNNFSDSGGGTSQVRYSEEEQAFYTNGHRLIKLTLKPNTKYTFSATSKKRSEGTSGYVWLLQSPYVLGFGEKTDNWERFSGTFTTNSTGVMSLYIYNSVYFKDIQLEESPIVTSYEPHKSNILSTSEDVVLRGIGEVQDTLDCLTGEVVERIGEIVLDGSENWVMSDYTRPNHLRLFCFQPKFKQYQNVINSRFPDIGNIQGRDVEGVYITNTFDIQVEHSRLSDVSVDGFKIWLSENPITVQARLSEESIKTVDLSSSGNWEKVILDGSEDEGWFSNFTDLGDGYYRFQGNLSMLKNPYKNENNYGMGFSDSFKWSASWTGKSEGFYFDSMIVIRILGSKLPSLSIEGCMQYLQQNPLTIYYLTATHQDSTQVKQPIFFKDGHIQLSSGVENSLIPTLDYQAKTSNSYVMDLMKTNTHYTMKAKSASGTFTIDGTSYNVGTNTTFTSPSSMTNKFLVMSDKTNEEVMILEEDVTDKTIPYFKGIKSAFEGEDKIEVLSTGKNLLDPSKFCGDERWLTLNNDQTISISQTASGAWYYLYKDLKIPTNTYITLEVLEGTYEGGNVGLFRNGKLLKELWWGDGGKKVHTYNQVYDELKIWSIRGNCKVRISITETEADYEPYKSNTTKIPLLSPLRSLPNGVCDELIIDQMKKKATLIQRIKTVTFDGSSDERWVGYNDGGTRVTQGFYHNVSDSVISRANVNLYCDTLQPNIDAIHSRDGRGVGMHNDGANNRNIRLCLLKNELIPYGFSEPLKSNENVLRKWLQDNPTTVCYELETPVITEVDLEGFPYIYKDGHIFLNGEITPVTEIKYSINQQHQIEANNQDIMRHQKEIDYLYNLIGEYVRVDYKNTLLSLNLELK